MLRLPALVFRELIDEVQTFLQNAVGSGSQHSEVGIKFGQFIPKFFILRIKRKDFFHTALSFAEHSQIFFLQSFQHMNVRNSGCFGFEHDYLSNRSSNFLIAFHAMSISLGSPRTLHSKRNAAHGDLEQAQDFFLRLARAAPFVEEAKLKEIQRVNVRIAQADGFREHRLALE